MEAIFVLFVLALMISGGCANKTITNKTATIIGHQRPGGSLGENDLRKIRPNQKIFQNDFGTGATEILTINNTETVKAEKQPQSFGEGDFGKTRPNQTIFQGDVEKIRPNQTIFPVDFGKIRPNHPNFQGYFGSGATEILTINDTETVIAEQQPEGFGSGGPGLIEKVQQNEEIIKHLVVGGFGGGNEIINQLETVIEQFFGGAPSSDLNADPIIQQQQTLLDEFFG